MDRRYDEPSTSPAHPAPPRAPSRRRQHDEHRRAATNPLEQVLFEVKRTIVGQDVLLERMAIGLLAGGHLLLEGVPGLAKTLAVKSLAAAIGGQFQRIQFTPDLVPADLTGTRVYRQHSGEFETSLGPGLLQPAARRRDQPGAGQGAERAARGDAGAPGHHRARDLPRTQPVPRHGDAEPDRVRGHLSAARGAGRPLHDEGRRATTPRRPRSTRSSSGRCSPAEPTQAILSPEDLVRMQASVAAGLRRPGDRRLRRTPGRRDPRAGDVGLGQLERYVTYGASPRASIALVLGGRALAFLRGRDYVLPHDVGRARPRRAAAPHRPVVRGPRGRRRPGHGHHRGAAQPSLMPEVVLQRR